MSGMSLPPALCRRAWVSPWQRSSPTAGVPGRRCCWSCWWCWGRR